MGKDASWIKSARALSAIMRKDEITLFVSEPAVNKIGEFNDELGQVVGTFRANVTTPAEAFGEETQGNTRPHFYQITLDPDIPISMDKKLFIRLDKVRQGIQGSIVEVTDLVGGLLGWTLSAADEVC